MTTSESNDQKSKEKRGTQPAVPDGFETLLTEDQLHRIEACQRFGWELHFIRRPLFLSPTVVLIDADNDKPWEVLDDGAPVPFANPRNT